MKFSYEWLKELVPNLPGPAETAGLLTMHALEVEEVARSGGDWYLDVDVLPNRMADASSHRGIAKELAAILAMQHSGHKATRLTLPDDAMEESEEPASSSVSVTITDKDGCVFYAARVMRGIEVKESPTWLRHRLSVLGVEPINNIVDAANYVMLEMGQPLHAFDLKKLAGKVSDGPKRIIVRKAVRDEKIKALDGETYTLDPSITVIADTKRVLAIGGIKGGAASGISEETKDIILEAANFDAERIYRASKATGIRTDASKRFEAGRTPSQTRAAIDRLAQLIQQIAGGDIAKGVVTAGSDTVRRRAISFDVVAAGRLLGVDVSSKMARIALEALGCTVKARGTTFVVTPPKDRMDLTIPEDLIEEVGRLIGYDVRHQALPGALLIPADTPDQYRWADKARDVLVAEGLVEVMRYSFVSEALMKEWGMLGHPMREMANPQSAELTHLRPSHLPNLLALAESERATRPAVRLFEVGALFYPKPQEKMYEFTGLSFVLAQEALQTPEGFVGEHAAYFEAKGVADALIESLGITDMTFAPLKETHDFWAEGRSAEVLLAGERVGIVGELDASIVKKHKSLGSIAIAEFNFDKIARSAAEEHQYQRPSKFPEVMRDVAVLVPLSVTADEVNQQIVTAGPNWLRDVDLFDYYEGDQVPEGQKSLAFRLAYQSDEKTLTDREVNKVQKVIQEALLDLGYEIR